MEPGHDAALMIRHARLAAAAAIALAMCLGSLAIAQQPAKKPRARPKPVAATPVDAATETKAVEEERERPPTSGAVDAGASSSIGIGIGTGAETPATGDGGTRTSPLTPASGEMPGSAAIDAGNVDYDRLLADIAALRTRVAAVGESLFQSRMAIAVRVEGDHGRLAKLAVSVDDGVVYTNPQGFRAEEATPVFARALAPGRHAVTIEVEREDRENVAFKTTQRSRFVVEVARDEQLDVSLRVEDDSSMADLPGKKRGEYDLRVRMKATSSAIKR